MKYFTSTAVAVLFIASPLSAGAEGPDWTAWIDMDNPSSEGDFETREAAFLNELSCETPVEIECRNVATKQSWELGGQVYACAPETGGVCRNTDQAGMCADYEVRFNCGTLTKSSLLPTNWPLWSAIIAGGLLGLGALTYALRQRKPGGTPPANTKHSLVAVNTSAQAPKQSKPKLSNPAIAGLPFAGSVMKPAISTRGTAQQAGSLTGPYAVLNEAFQATGRIGFAQEGVPSTDDVAFGTGFLISDRHVLTNRHVFEMYRKNLLENGGGIEFYAEKGSDATDFFAFNGEEPILIDGLDIAVFELATPINHRAPIAIKDTETASLDGRDIVVIGYPCPAEITDEIKAIVEADAIFAVKRLSEGQIFQHSSDTDSVYGIEAATSQIISQTKRMNAICHNASTLGGSSGSPVLDRETGQLLAVHFGFDVAFAWGEPANFAIPVADVRKALDAAGLLE